MHSKFFSRKFLLALFFTVVTTVGFFLGKLTGIEWVSFVGLILGAYGAANVMHKRVA